MDYDNLFEYKKSLINYINFAHSPQKDERRGGRERTTHMEERSVIGTDLGTISRRGVKNKLRNRKDELQKLNVLNEVNEELGLGDY